VSENGSKSKVPRKSKAADRGKLKIGDDWNAIRIIALSQSNPLKAIAEFVENSIDARLRPSRSRAAVSTESITFRSRMTATACPATRRGGQISSTSRRTFAIRSSGG